jgi:hypothetical protein
VADKIQIGLEDQTAAGAASVAQNLEKVEGAAAEVEQQFDAVGQAAADTVDAMQAEIDDLTQQVEELEHELGDAAKATDKLGDRGASVKKLTLRLTEMNQGLELLKKGAQLVASAVNTLAEEGNPAFVGLQRSAANVRAELLRIAESPEIQEFITGLANRIETEFIPALKDMGAEAGPAMNSVADGFRAAQRWISNVNIALGVYLGEIDEVVAAELELSAGRDKAAQEDAARQAEKNRRSREAAEAQMTLGTLDKKLAEESELRAIAEITNTAQLNAMLDQERQSLIANAEAGGKSGRSREDSLKRIELIQRRLTEIPKQEADAYKKAIDEERKRQQDAADAALKEAESLAQQRLDIKIKFIELERQAEEDAAQKRLDILKAERDARVKLIEQADGGKLLQNAKQAIDPRDVARQVGAQRAAAAREKFTRDNAGGLDLSDANAVRQFNAQRNQAAAAAGRQGFRDVATGRASEQEIGQAQTSLIQASAQQAVAAGQLGASTAQALIQAANNQQQLAQQQAQQQAQIDAVRQALGVVNSSVQNTRSRAQSGGLRR